MADHSENLAWGLKATRTRRHHRIAVPPQVPEEIVPVEGLHQRRRRRLVKFHPQESADAVEPTDPLNDDDDDDGQSSMVKNGKKMVVSDSEDEHNAALEISGKRRNRIQEADDEEEPGPDNFKLELENARCTRKPRSRANQIAYAYPDINEAQKPQGPEVTEIAKRKEHKTMRKLVKNHKEESPDEVADPTFSLSGDDKEEGLTLNKNRKARHGSRVSDSEDDMKQVLGKNSRKRYFIQESDEEEEAGLTQDFVNNENETEKMSEFRLELTKEEIAKDIMYLTGKELRRKSTRLNANRRESEGTNVVLLPGSSIPETVKPDSYDLPKSQS